MSYTMCIKRELESSGKYVHCSGEISGYNCNSATLLIVDGKNEMSHPSVTVQYSRGHSRKLINNAFTA